MRKIHFLLLFIFSLGFSQTHRFIYEVNFKRDSTENSITKENYHLDITDNESVYYNRDYFIMDSVFAANAQLPAPPSMSNVIKHKLDSDDFEEYELLEYELLKIPSTTKQNWKLSDEKKQFQDFNLQKAETDWAGRHWIAWFSPQIPFNTGPYKFGGLPGLIVELNDSKNNFNFQLIKSENLAEASKVRTLDGFPNPVTVTYEQYKKKKISNYQDPLAFINTTEFNFENSEGIFLKDGTLVKPDNVREVRLTQQKLIRKYNNPIEQDKAIKYPLK